MRVIAKTKHGLMLVNDLDPYIGPSLIKLGEFSRGEVDLFSAVIQPGWRVADIGANIGAHTVVFSHLVGDSGIVWAFEPQRLVFQNLCANLALNEVENVLAYQAAVGDTIETISLGTVSQKTAVNFGGVSLDLLRGKGGEPTPLTPFTDDVHFMKIDVEGMEATVIRGAASMIRRVHPFIYLECDRDELRAELVALLEDLGYTPRWHIVPLYDPDNPNGAANPWKGSLVSYNLICQPPGITLFDHLPLGKEPPQ